MSESDTGFGTAFVFWRNLPAIHNAPLAQALARHSQVPVIVVAETDVSKARLAQGWSRPEFDPAQLITAPSRSERVELLRRYGTEGAFHLFSGFRAYPETSWTLKRAIGSQATVGVNLEPLRDHDGLKAGLRRSVYRLLALRWRDRIDCLLVNGSMGLETYVQLGFPARITFPFCYVVSEVLSKSESEADPSDDGACVRLLFVGQLIRRKGYDVLLSALNAIKDETWAIDVVGSGRLATRYKSRTASMGLSDRIRWMGTLPNVEVRRCMSRSDILILPSRFDGWGAVVNEALTAGMRVLVSSSCGSADLVQPGNGGRVFLSECPDSLAKELRWMIQQGRVTVDERQKIRDWAAKSISPPVIARYLQEIARFVQGRGGKPAAPWIQG